MCVLRIIVLLLIPYYLLNSQTAIDIIKKSEENLKGETSEGIFTMKVVTPDYIRTVKMKAFNDGYDKALIITLSPKKEEGNKMLKIKNELWSYLKATETTMKLPASMMLQSWNGSDLTNDDLVRESKLIDDYNINLMFDEIIAGENCWKLELLPKPDVPVVWGKLYYWVRKSDYLPALVQYYDENGKLHRTMKFSDYKFMSGRKVPGTWTIINNKKEGHYTEFIYNEVKFDIKIPDKIFSFRELEK